MINFAATRVRLHTITLALPNTVIPLVLFVNVEVVKITEQKPVTLAKRKKPEIDGRI